LDANSKNTEEAETLGKTGIHIEYNAIESSGDGETSMNITYINVFQKILSI